MRNRVRWMVGLVVVVGVAAAAFAWSGAGLRALAQVEPEALVVGGNPAPITIPGTGTAGNAAPYPSASGAITGANGTITRVRVQLTGFTHSYPDDVDIVLVGPGGQRSMIMSDAGGAANVMTPITLTFDSTSANTLPNAGPLATGTTKPANYDGAGADTFPGSGPGAIPDTEPADLSVFNGLDPNGTWNLFVVDDTGDDQGSIASGWLILIDVADTLTVNSLADTNDGTCNAANCTLREAINRVNAGFGGDTINFSVNGTITLTSGQLVVGKNVTINGPGASMLTVSGNNASRIFSISNGVAANISGLTLTNGNGVGAPSLSGGAILNNIGTLNLSSS
ncbi:MAG: CSLREA domain-containing protein, partial [Pyrinomonadaceae bacterium]